MTNQGGKGLPQQLRDSSALLEIPDTGYTKICPDCGGGRHGCKREMIGRERALMLEKCQTCEERPPEWARTERVERARVAIDVKSGTRKGYGRPRKVEV